MEGVISIVTDPIYHLAFTFIVGGVKLFAPRALLPFVQFFIGLYLLGAVSSTLIVVYWAKHTSDKRKSGLKGLAHFICGVGSTTMPMAVMICHSYGIMPDSLEYLYFPALALFFATGVLSAPLMLSHNKDGLNRALAVYPSISRLFLIGWLSNLYYPLTALAIQTRSPIILTVTAIVSLIETYFVFWESFIGFYRNFWVKQTPRKAHTSGIVANAFQLSTQWDGPLLRPDWFYHTTATRVGIVFAVFTGFAWNYAVWKSIWYPTEVPQAALATCMITIMLSCWHNNLDVFLLTAIMRGTTTTEWQAKLAVFLYNYNGLVLPLFWSFVTLDPFEAFTFCFLYEGGCDARPSFLSETTKIYPIVDSCNFTQVVAMRDLAAF